MQDPLPSKRKQPEGLGFKLRVSGLNMNQTILYTLNLPKPEV